jgi:hypothetical protein
MCYVNLVCKMTYKENFVSKYKSYAMKGSKIAVLNKKII